GAAPAEQGAPRDRRRRGRRRQRAGGSGLRGPQRLPVGVHGGSRDRQRLRGERASVADRDAVRRVRRRRRGEQARHGAGRARVPRVDRLRRTAPDARHAQAHDPPARCRPRRRPARDGRDPLRLVRRDRPHRGDLAAAADAHEPDPRRDPPHPSVRVRGDAAPRGLLRLGRPVPLRLRPPRRRRGHRRGSARERRHRACDQPRPKALPGKRVRDDDL
ncbi:MAG: hypothetical protein AVDCRST_MAG85-4269, partial [uncultured Solirubrobacteraceae bacterium]